MTPDQLEALLQQPESATLEFKREWYRLDDPDQQVKTKERAEFIKDVLSLANGNAATAGETAYLIIGADDEIQKDGTRVVVGVTTPVPNPSSLLSHVNKACRPTLDNLFCYEMRLHGKRMIVVEIPPTPHLHETICRLQTKGQTYTEHITLYREHGGVRVADARQREAIQELKRKRYADRDNVHPTWFGAIIGAIIGGLITRHYQQKPSPNRQIEQAIAGGLVGAFLGAGSGSSYRSLRRFWFDLEGEHWLRKVGAVAALILLSLGFSYIFINLFQRLAVKMRSTVHSSPVDTPAVLP